MLNLRYTLDSLVQVCNRIPLSSGETELVVDGTKTLYSFGVKQKDGLVKNVGHLNTRFLGTEVSGGYNGVIIGLYTTGNGRKCESYADFDWFIYQPKE